MKNNPHFSASIPCGTEEWKHSPYSVFLAWLESIALRWVNKHEGLRTPIQMSWQSLYLNMHFSPPLCWSLSLSLSLCSVRLRYEWLSASRWLRCWGIGSTRLEAVPAILCSRRARGKREVWKNRCSAGRPLPASHRCVWFQVSPNGPALLGYKSVRHRCLFDTV